MSRFLQQGKIQHTSSTHQSLVKPESDLLTDVYMAGEQIIRYKSFDHAAMILDKSALN